MPSEKVATSVSTSVAGSTVGASSPNTAVSGKTVVPGGMRSGFSSSASNCAAASVVSCASAASTSSWATCGNSSRVPPRVAAGFERSEEHTSELQSRQYLVCRLLLEKKKKNISSTQYINKKKQI